MRRSRRVEALSSIAVAWVSATSQLPLHYVWSRPSLLRCQRDQAGLLDPAASAHAQLPAELERGASGCRPTSAPSVWPLAALGTRPVQWKQHRMLSRARGIALSLTEREP